MAISEMALRAALRRKFHGNSRALLARLGLDANELSGGAGKDPPKAMRGGLGGEHAVAIMDFLGGKLSAEEMSELNLLLDRWLGESEVAAAEDDEPEPDRLLAHLKAKGLSDRDAAAAIEIARNGGGKDNLPANGLHGGMGGAMDRRLRSSDADFFARYPGAELITPGASGMAFDRRRKAPAPSELDDREFFERFPMAERINF